MDFYRGELSVNHMGSQTGKLEMDEKQKGGAMLHVLFAITFLSLVTSAMLMMGLSSQVSVRGDQQSKQAIYAAEAGLEAAYSAVQHYVQIHADPHNINVNKLQQMLPPFEVQGIAVIVTIGHDQMDSQMMNVTAVATGTEGKYSVQASLPRKKPDSGWPTIMYTNRREM